MAMSENVMNVRGRDMNIKYILTQECRQGPALYMSRASRRDVMHSVTVCYAKRTYTSHRIHVHSHYSRVTLASISSH